MLAAVADLTGAVLIFIGAFLCLAAAVALVRFPDALAKMHAITKPQVLGLMCVALGIALSIRSWWASGLCLLIVAIQLITAPVSANMVARGAYRAGQIEERWLRIDELAEDLEKAGYRKPR